MLYFLLNDHLNVVAVSGKHPVGSGMQWARQPGRNGLQAGWLNRNDLANFEQAEVIAESASRMLSKDKAKYIATDSGSGCYPRFDVILAPKVGDEVSMSFNGDSYPVGKIVKISDSLRVVTAARDPGGDLVTFYRRKLSGAWLHSRYWAMIPGSVYEQNPSF